MFYFWESSALAEGEVSRLRKGAILVQIVATAATGSAARCAVTKPVCRTERSFRQQMLSPP
jgi:hypothetical protein